MADDLLLIEKPIHGAAQITINRPNAKNALSRELRRQLTAAIDALADRDDARVLILTGAGDTFCAGLDMKELGAAGSSEVFGFEDREMNPVAALQAFPGPVIGAINGAAITGGLELALACDVLVCSRNARFADTHARVGVMPAWGLSQRLSRAIGVYRARELSLTGNFLTAERAEAWGLVNRVVEASTLLAETTQLASEMLSAVPHMLSAYKRLINEGFELPLGEGLSLETARGISASLSVDPAEVELRRREVLVRSQAQRKAV